MVTEYASTKELNEFMVMEESIPNPDVKGGERLLEVVGYGDNVKTKYFLDNASIIANTYNIYVGDSDESAYNTVLVESTDYIMNKDLGFITLTASGVAALGTNTLYAGYSFCKLQFSDTELQKQLDRSAAMIDKKTRNHWADGSKESPNYNVISDEKHKGQGVYNRSYYTLNRPLPDVKTFLMVAVAKDDDTIEVESTTGFPESGVLGIGIEKLTYSSKTATEFVLTTPATDEHVASDFVYPFVFEASNSVDGMNPTWVVLEANHDYDLQLETGRVHLSNADFNVSEAQAFANSPQIWIPNRFRMSYLRGNDTIPDDINQLCLMLASKDLLHRAVRKAHSSGFNDFDPELISVDEDWIKDTIKSHKNALISKAN